jgi:hypothetical protein
MSFDQINQSVNDSRQGNERKLKKRRRQNLSKEDKPSE